MKAKCNKMVPQGFRVGEPRSDVCFVKANLYTNRESGLNDGRWNGSAAMAIRPSLSKYLICALVMARIWLARCQL